MTIPAPDIPSSMTTPAPEIPPSMTTPAPNIQNPGVKFEIPVTPNEVGEDGGEFIRRYDALAGEIDDDMVKGLKEQLDGLLIFVSPSPIIAQYSCSSC